MRALVYSYRKQENDIVQELNLFISSFETESHVLPFMLGYRKFDLYVFDTEGMPDAEKAEFYARLEEYMRARPSLGFISWGPGTHFSLANMRPMAVKLDNYANGGLHDWLEQISRLVQWRADLIEKYKPRKTQLGGQNDTYYGDGDYDFGEPT